MHAKYLAATALAVILAASAAIDASGKPVKPPTAAEATAFVARAEADLAKEGEYLNRAAWVQATYITQDTNWLVAKANAEVTCTDARGRV